jgi:hypothetical protein
MKLEIEGMYLNIVKTICNKLITNIMLKGEKLKSFPLKSGMRQGCPLFPLQHSLRIPSRSNKAGNRNTRNIRR